MPPVSAESSRAKDSPAPPFNTAPRPWLERVQRHLDRLLVVDVFVVLAGALWFGLGVGLHLRGSEAMLFSFQRLWPVVFQPAIGLLMGAALLSGALGWWRRQGQR